MLPSKATVILVVLAAACGASLYACSLNPQPLPPGLTEDGGNGGADAGLTQSADGGSSSGSVGDATFRNDTGAIPVPGSDAEADGATDAEPPSVDGASDAGMEEGG